MLLPIKGYIVLVYLDKPEFNDWNTIVVELQKEDLKIDYVTSLKQRRT